MKKITITIRTINAAFDPNPAPEVIRILSNTIIQLQTDGQLENLTLRDSNGNPVGRLLVE